MFCDLVKMDSRNKLYHCSSCEKSFSTRLVLSEHEASHCGGMFSCYHCGEVTRTLTQMVLHKRRHITEDQNQILSLGETDSFASASRELEPGNMQWPLKLDIKEEVCSNNTPDEMDMYQPIQVKGIKNVVDPINPIANMDLDQAVKQEMAVTFQPYECSLFDKCLARKCKTNDSRTTSGEKPYQCNLCDKYVARKQDLMTHQKIHTGELYQCCHCGKCFAQKDEMLTHKMIHIFENEAMDSHCRVCGRCDFRLLKPLKPTWRNMLVWMYQLLDFDAERTGTQMICRQCEFNLLFSYSYSVRFQNPKSGINVVVWDSDGRCPVYHRDGIPYSYYVSLIALEPLPDHMVLYPKLLDNMPRDKLTHKLTLCNICKTII